MLSIMIEENGQPVAQVLVFKTEINCMEKKITKEHGLI